MTTDSTENRELDTSYSVSEILPIVSCRFMFSPFHCVFQRYVHIAMSYEHTYIALDVSKIFDKEEILAFLYRKYFTDFTAVEVFLNIVFMQLQFLTNVVNLTIASSKF